MLVFLAAALIFINVWIKNRISGPIEKLQKAAGEFEDKCRKRAAPSELTMNDPEIHTGDEIESLSQSIISMVGDVQSYATDLLEKDREIRKKEGEISSMREYVSQLDELAYQDSLTGAGNKAAYEKAAQKLNSDIEAGNVDFGIVMCDLNYLKRINDNYGHEYGDILIQTGADLLKKVWKNNFIYRIGGDEFTIIYSDVEKELVEKDILLLEEEINNYNLKNDGKKLGLQMAIGMAIYDPENDLEYMDVFRKADSAMYENKKQKKDMRRRMDYGVY
jgi:diguanylate cyclase (GGDEF)-like protein